MKAIAARLSANSLLYSPFEYCKLVANSGASAIASSCLGLQTESASLALSAGHSSSGCSSSIASSASFPSAAGAISPASLLSLPVEGKLLGARNRAIAH